VGRLKSSAEKEAMAEKRIRHGGVQTIKEGQSKWRSKEKKRLVEESARHHSPMRGVRAAGDKKGQHKKQEGAQENLFILNAMAGQKKPMQVRGTPRGSGIGRSNRKRECTRKGCTTSGG